jgi:hypothetical protein
MSPSARRRLRITGRYVVLVVVAVLILFPIWTTLMGALKPGPKLLDYPAHCCRSISRSTPCARPGASATSTGISSTAPSSRSPSRSARS